VPGFRFGRQPASELESFNGRSGWQVVSYGPAWSQENGISVPIYFPKPSSLSTEPCGAIGSVHTTIKRCTGGHRRVVQGLPCSFSDKEGPEVSSRYGRTGMLVRKEAQ
jgi:hypothetical protein